MNLLDIVDNSLKKRTINLVIGALLVSNSISAQIWQEDFASYLDGTTIGIDNNNPPAGIDWTVDSQGAGYFRVESNQFETFDTQAEVTWTSEVIDISGSNRVYVTADLIASFATNDDDVLSIYYKLDGGAEQNFGSVTGVFFGATTAAAAYSLSGSTIQIIVKANTTNQPFFGINDFVQFDNVTITQQTLVYSIANGNWNTVGTWSATSGGPSCGCTPASTDFAYIESPYTVSLNATSQIAGVDIANGATLQWTASADLEFVGGSLTIATGGTLIPNGNNADIVISNTGLYQITNNGAMSIRNLNFNVSSIIILLGASNIDISNDLLFGDDILFTNDNTGTVTVGNEINFESFFGNNSSVLINNGTMNINNRILIDDDDPSITNNGTLSITNDIEVGGSNDDNWDITNTGSMSFTNLDASNANFTFDNSGTIVQTGEFQNMGGTESIRNNTPGQWSYEGAIFDGGTQIYCNVDGLNTFTYSRVGVQNIITPQDSYYNLTITGGGAKTMIGASTVTGSLTLINGIVVSTAANLLTLNDGAISTSGNASSFVDGPIKKIGDDAFTFPTGDGTNWARIAISAPSNATDEFTAEYFVAGYVDLSVDGSLNHVSAYEYWNLSQDVGSSTPTVQLFWEDASSTGSDINLAATSTDLVVASYSSGSVWTSEGQSAINQADPGDVTSSPVPAANFGPFTLGSIGGENPLPIELISFTGTQVNDAVLLSWETATELNNDFFNLKRSYDGYEFKTVKIIKGNGTSSDAIKYEHEDYPLYSGIIYYRLSQTDFDGTSETFNIIGVQYDMNSKSIQVFPNPVSDNQFTVLLPSNPLGIVYVKIYSYTGKLIYNRNVMDPKNPLALKLDNNHNSGLHFLLIETGTTRFRTKLILE